MGFNFIYWTPLGGYYFLWVLIWKNMENSGKKRPFFQADMAGLGKYSMGGYGL